MDVIEFGLMDDGLHYQISINGVVTWVDCSPADVDAIMEVTSI